LDSGRIPYKVQERGGQKVAVKEEDLPEVVDAVNQMGIQEWTGVGWALKTLMFEFNLKKGGKNIIK
jgi:hypothetical protein